MSSKAELARQLFQKRANCAQAVLGAFASECNLELEQAYLIASGFGGGIGRQREVCGAVSGMVLVLNLLYGYNDLQDKSLKDAHYKRIQELCDQFKAQAGSIICRELLSGSTAQDHTPISSERSEEYYRKRPCSELVALAAGILDQYHHNHSS